MGQWLTISSRTPAARYSSATVSSRPSSVTITSSSCAGAIETSDARPNLLASISPTVRPAAARAALTTSASGRRDVVSPASSVTPRRRHERRVEVQLGHELDRPASGQHPHVLVELAGADDDVHRLGDHLVGDRRRVRDQRQLVRRVLHQPPRQRQRGRRRVEEDRRARHDQRRRVVGDRHLRRARLLDPLRPRSRDQRQRAEPADRPRATVDAFDQALASELLEVSVHGDRRDRMVAGQLGDRYAAVPLDAFQDLCSAQRWWHGAQTRSSNALRVTLTCSGRNSSMAFTR